MRDDETSPGAPPPSDLRRAGLCVTLLLGALLGGVGCGAAPQASMATGAATATGATVTAVPTASRADAPSSRASRAPCAPVSRLVASLKRPLHIDAYVARGLPSLDAFERALREVLEEYREAGGARVDYSILEAKDEVTKKKALDAGLVERAFGEASPDGEKAALVQGVMGFVFEYGEQKSASAFLPPDQREELALWIYNQIRTARDTGDDIRHAIGILTGHGEIGPKESDLMPASMAKVSIQDIIAQNFAFYRFVDVDLRSGDAEIPDDLAGLVVSQPATDLTDKELRRIDQFVMKGKPLAVFASAVNVRAGDATLKATLSTHGLEKLLAGYGVVVARDAVLDPGHSAHVAAKTRTGLAAVDLVQVLEVQNQGPGGQEPRIDAAFPCLLGIEDVAVPFASGLTLEPSKQPGARMRVVMRSSPSAVHLAGEHVDLRPFQKWTQLAGIPQQQYAIAASVEGTLQTAFPEGDKQGTATPAQSAGPARVFVLASSQFLANPLVRAGAVSAPGPHAAKRPDLDDDTPMLLLAKPYAQQFATASILVFKNTLDWMLLDGDPNAGECRAAVPGGAGGR